MSWEPVVAVGRWGRLQIVIDGRDVTFFRDIPTEILSWSSGDPFDDASLIIRFPQISPFEELGKDEIDWLDGHRLVDLYLVRPDETKKKLWEGMIASIDEDTTDTDSSITAQCIGALYQLDYYVRAPKNLSEDQARLYERAIADEFYPPSDKVALRTSRCRVEYPDGMEDSGFITRYSGGWEKTLTQYIQRLLADMVHNPGFMREPGSEEIPPTPGINAVQEVVLDPEPPPWPWGSTYPSATLNGTFALEFRGLWTTGLRWDSTASDVKARLQALSNIDEVNVTGSGTNNSPWRIEFVGSKVRQRKQPRMKLDHSDLRHNHPTTRVTIIEHGEEGDDGEPAVPPSDPDPWEGAWTLMKNNGRIPVLKLRDEETVDWTVTVGQPGVSHSLKSDFSQTPNVIFGEGTDESATTWRNSTVEVTGSAETITRHHPLAWDERVHPARKDQSETGEETDPPPEEFSEDHVRVEIIQKYGSGVSLLDAKRSADQQIQRESSPGWFGTITLSSDPQEGSRFEIKAGTNLLLRHFRKHVPKNEDDPLPDPEEQGIVLHVAQAEVNFDNGTVDLTVDSKARDLATLAQLIERTKSENQNPAKMLMVNRESSRTDDTKFPWDYNAGSGSLTTESMAARRSDESLPIGRPDITPERFVFVNGTHHDPFKRWGIVSMVAAGKGTISRSEVRAFNEFGQPLEIPFHVGIYQEEISAYAMPLHPFQEGVWTPDPKEALTGFDPTAAVLWGQGGQRAGYWPGLESEGNPPTGIMIDEGTWQFEVSSLGTSVLWVAIYAEVDAYFQGRFFHGVQ